MLTTSLKVAEFFGRQHNDVLKAIRKLNADVDNEGKISFVEMFRESTYTDQKSESRPMYFMNRDGFTLLAMGFTGKKALQEDVARGLGFVKTEEKFSTTSGRNEIYESVRWARVNSYLNDFGFIPTSGDAVKAFSVFRKKLQKMIGAFQAAFCGFFTASNDAAFSPIFLTISLQARFDGARDIGERSTGHWGTEHGTLGNGARDIGERLKAQKCAENPHHV